jgi:hypothetical protein
MLVDTEFLEWITGKLTVACDYHVPSAPFLLSETPSFKLAKSAVNLERGTKREGSHEVSLINATFHTVEIT